MTFAIVALGAIFFVVDPLATVPIFLSITRGDPLEQKTSAAARAAIAAFIALSVFAVAGKIIFDLFGISLSAFKIAGGLLLLLMSIDMIRAQPSRTRSSQEELAESQDKEDVALVPLAIPMLAGPGAIATVMVLMSRAGGRPYAVAAVFFAIAVTCLAAWLLMRWGARYEGALPRTYLHALERVMGLLLAAIAIEFIAGGVRELFPALQQP